MAMKILMAVVPRIDLNTRKMIAATIRMSRMSIQEKFKNSSIYDEF